MDRVNEIIENVKKKGDEAVIEYIKEFDGIQLSENELEIGEKEFLLQFLCAPFLQKLPVFQKS